MAQLGTDFLFGRDLDSNAAVLVYVKVELCCEGFTEANVGKTRKQVSHLVIAVLFSLIKEMLKGSQSSLNRAPLSFLRLISSITVTTVSFVLKRIQS